MSEVIYIKETKEFMMENGTIVKVCDLSKEEVTELMSECSKVNRLFGSSTQDSDVLKG